jgi:anti-anti-sigma factor
METQNGRNPTSPHLSAVPAPFRVVESAADGRRVIAACGELDLATATQLEARLAGNIDTVLDLSELSFIDSTGLRVLVSTAHRAQAEAWEFTLRNPQPTVLRVIKLVALEQLLGLESQPTPAPQRERAAR